MVRHSEKPHGDFLPATIHAITFPHCSLPSFATQIAGGTQGYNSLNWAEHEKNLAISTILGSLIYFLVANPYCGNVARKCKSFTH